MDYDPIKDRLIRGFEGSTTGHRVFFWILHRVFLRSWYVRRALRRHLSGTDAHVLDAGTGFGQYTDWMLRRFERVRVTSVDIKRDYLDRLGSYLNRTGLSDRAAVRYGDLVKLEETGPYDLVLSVDVMEHIEEDETVFAHFARVLRPGGVLIVNTPSDQGGSGVTEEGEESFIGEHVRDGYGVAEITDKLQRAGFDKVHTEFGYGFWGSLAWRLLVQVPMRLLSTSMVLVVLLPLWYLPALPLGLLLNAIDLKVQNSTGTGLTVTAVRVQGGKVA
ncbi:MAG: class I SAM-dependent methyltransferase [Rhodothermales bacterium]|nr:class I SAM-dependent methyltransferase [Rhodothermales bacterium]MBO6778870.1 class I SAM-dependent methyltransferase [Rhodothermales bacterium]